MKGEHTMRKRNTLCILPLCVALLSGCAAPGSPEAAVNELADEHQVVNVFELDRAEVPVGLDGKKLASLELPSAYTLSIPENPELAENPQTIAESADDLSAFPEDFTVSDEADGTMFLVEVKDGSAMTFSDLEEMYPGGTAFTSDGNACYLLGPGTGYTGVRLGSLTVYYELDPDTGAYLALGYDGPIADFADESDLGELLSSWVHLEA